MTELVKRFVVEEDGQTLVEYALLIALISLGLIATLTAFRGTLKNVFTQASDTMGGVSVPAAPSPE